MQEKQDKIEEIEHDDEIEDVGTPLVSWEAWERPPNDRSRNWYIIASVIGAALLVYCVITANYLFAVIVLMMGVILLMNGLKRPKRVEVHVTDMGIVFGNTYNDFKDIKEFAIVYEPPIVKTLYVDFNSVLRPMISIPLEGVDPNAVREALLPYAFENLEREEETLTDILRRLYKM
ncbi:hypothetical protein HN358_02220 [Candidatus Uhrbacteria bacterium]|nr:hypothetical protein [Candidatus Uhrbacteria bacterium]MBT7717496.1 hypothetical protein [Candidatus Uhrbacteria bacterium]